MRLFSKKRYLESEIIPQPLYVFSYDGNYKQAYLTAENDKNAVQLAKKHIKFDNSCSLFKCEGFKFTAKGSHWLGQNIPEELWGRNLLID